MIDTDKYEGHTEGKWILGEYKGRPSISAVEDVETPTWVRNIARGLNPSQTADHALLLDAPILLEAYKQLREKQIRYMKIIGEFDEFMCNNWTPENVHGLWNGLFTKYFPELTMEEEE